MKVFQNLLVITSLALTACASVPSAKLLTGDSAANFFSEPQGGKGVIYFACGKWFTKTALMDSENELPACEFVVNGRQYVQLKKGNVGKLELPSGIYEIKHADATMSVAIATSVDLKSGETHLAVADYTHKTGVMGGALSGNHVFSISTSKITADKVRQKSPVLMTPSN